MENADSIAATHRLGQLLWRFRPGFWAISRDILFGVLLLLPALLPGLGVLAALSEIPTPVDAGWLIGLLIMTLITLGFMSASGYYFYRAVQQSRHQIVFYEQGIVSIRGQNIQVGRYKEMTVLQRIVNQYLGRFFTIPVFQIGTDYFLTIQFPDGAKVKARDRRVSELLEEKVYQSQYPQAVATYNQGKELNFGEIKVSQRGLTFGGEIFVWSAVANIKLHNGEFIVTRNEGGWLNQMTVPASQIPNVFILLELLRQVCPVAQLR